MVYTCLRALLVAMKGRYAQQKTFGDNFWDVLSKNPLDMPYIL
jgi:hypothetical protein